MRLGTFVAALALGFAVATPGEAQRRADPLIGAEYGPPDVGVSSARTPLPPVAPPPCSSGPGREIVLGALFGVVVSGTIVFFAAVGRAASTMGRDRINGTPYVVGGALLGAALGVASYNRRCG